jgi:predicted metal-dependent hydrolase
MLSFIQMFKRNIPLRTRETRVITLDSGEIPFTLVTSRLARGIRMSISANKGLEITVPSRLSEQAMRNYIDEKESWIIRNLKKIEAQKKSKVVFADGAEIEILGNKKTLRLITKKGLRSYVEENPEEILIYCSGIIDAKCTLEKHLKKLAKIYFSVHIEQISAHMGTRYGRITIRSQNSRWGSCSRRGNLNFNWKLMLFPPPVVDYVIMHELAHTVHLNHSERFYALLSKYCPDYKLLRKTLRTADPAL